MSEVMQQEQKDQILQMEAKRYCDSLSGVRRITLVEKLLDELPGNFQNSRNSNCALCLVKNNGMWIVSYVNDNDSVEYSYMKNNVLEALVCMAIKKGILKYV